MLKTSRALVAALALCVSTPAFADTPVTLRARIEASGPAITLGDLFVGAGDVAGRAVAPAPAAGQTTMLPADFLVAAAQSAGLAWSPPTGMAQVRVVRPGGARAMLAPETPARGAAEIAVRRGEIIDLVYAAPGLQLATRARALGNGGIGETVRLINLQSNRTIEATITGPGAAAVNTP